MSEQKQVLEAQGSDVEAAIAAGLSRLGVSRNQVDVEVLDRGSRGLLGLGSREATVRLTVKGRAAKAAPAARPQRAPRPQPKPAAETRPAPAPARTKAPQPVEREVKATAVVDEAEVDEEQQREQQVAMETVQTLLDKMQVTADVSVSLTEPDERTGRRIPIIAVDGDDLSVLIGPRGETLQALQYISRLMVGHQLRGRTSFVIDVGGYRQRRQETLARLAERMAGKVLKRKRAVTLEPMPPNERRLIHIALRDHDAVYTESTGEGRERRVRIYPKN